MKNLIGKRVRGFRFESTYTTPYARSMDKHIGEVGTIEKYLSSKDEVRVQFENDWWHYPADLAKLHLVEDEFVLPEKWAIRPKNEKEGAAVLEWFNTNGERRYDRGLENRYYWHFPAYEPRNHCLMSGIIKNKDYSEITFEQFEKHVLNRKSVKEEKMENAVKVTKTDLGKIHTVACDTWKKKIIELASRNPFGNEVELTQKEVDEMFNAATRDQRPVLVNIFGEPKKPIDFDRIKTGSKVMITRTGKHCSGFTNIDASKPVNVIFYKTPYFINTNSRVFNLKAVNSSYCTFEQDGNFILFSSHDGIDYITEVIEY